MRRFIQGLIVVNIAIVAITTVAQYMHDSAQAAAGSLFSNALFDLVALSITFVAVSLVVFARFEGDPAWLFVPVAFLFPLASVATYQAFTSGGPVAPAAIRALFVVGYLAGYFVLRAASPSAQRSPRGITETP